MVWGMNAELTRPGSDLRYVSHMSHELRTPLNAIIGAASLLDRDRMEDDQRELIDTVRLASETHQFKVAQAAAPGLCLQP